MQAESAASGVDLGAAGTAGGGATGSVGWACASECAVVTAKTVESNTAGPRIDDAWMTTVNFVFRISNGGKSQPRSLNTLGTIQRVRVVAQPRRDHIARRLCKFAQHRDHMGAIHARLHEQLRAAQIGLRL